MKFGYILITLLVLSVPLLAANVVTTCITNKTLQTNETYILNINGNLTTLNLTNEMDCPLGCSISSGACADSGDFSILTIGVAVIALFFGFMSTQIRENRELQMMLFLISMLLLIVDISIMAQIAATNIKNILDTTQLLLIFATVIFVSYYIIKLLQDQFTKLKESRKQKLQGLS